MNASEDIGVRALDMVPPAPQIVNDEPDAEELVVIPAAHAPEDVGDLAHDLEQQALQILNDEPDAEELVVIPAEHAPEDVGDLPHDLEQLALQIRNDEPDAEELVVNPAEHAPEDVGDLAHDLEQLALHILNDEPDAAHHAFEDDGVLAQDLEQLVLQILDEPDAEEIVVNQEEQAAVDDAPNNPVAEVPIIINPEEAEAPNAHLALNSINSWDLPKDIDLDNGLQRNILFSIWLEFRYIADHITQRKTIPQIYSLRNHTRGSYSSLFEYQRLQLRLLRDDYMANLLDGLQQMLELRCKKIANDETKRQVPIETNGVYRVYYKKSIELESATGKFVVYLTSQEVDEIRRQDQLQSTKKVASRISTTRNPTQLEEDELSGVCSTGSVPFMKGSLLLFTQNATQFTELLAATVVARHLDDPKRPASSASQTDIQEYERREAFSPWRPYIEIDLMRVYGQVRSDFLGQPMDLLEPRQYFDPIYNVHRRIADLSTETMPFVSELIHAKRLPFMPDYLQPLTVEQSVYRSASGLELPLRTESGADSVWPEPELLGWNANQTSALRHALSTRVAMIQGAPGTGKTLVGRELIQLLLANTAHRIVVLCHSDQALDQFVRGLVEQTTYGRPDIVVRMGSHTGEPELLSDLLECRAADVKGADRKAYESAAYDTKNESMLKTAELAEWLRVNRRSGRCLDAVSMNRTLNVLRQLRVRERGVQQALRLAKLRERRVFAMTSSFAARHSTFLELVAAPIVIVDEASEHLETHVVAALNPHTQHFIQIGDQWNIRPRNCSHRTDSQTAMNVSLFERMHNNELPCVLLNVQHRAHKRLADLIRCGIYANLEDAAQVSLARPTFRGMPARLQFVDHRHPEQEACDGESLHNVGEAGLVRATCAYLLQQGYRPADIAVLCTYRGQVAQLELGDGPGSQTCHGCPVTVVDAFAGREARIVLLSLVRNNAEGKVGFMANVYRASVALSRARDALIMFGNLGDLVMRSDAWANVMRMLAPEPGYIGHGAVMVRCEQHGTMTEVTHAEGFDCLSLGGCTQKCLRQLSCRHRCELMCHGAATKHQCQVQTCVRERKISP